MGYDGRRYVRAWAPKTSDWRWEIRGKFTCQEWKEGFRGIVLEGVEGMSVRGRTQ